MSVEMGDVVYTKVTFNTAMSDDEDGGDRHGGIELMVDDPNLVRKLLK